MDEVVFGRYRLIALIGEGGMGKVYKAHDSVIGRDVAIKVLPPEMSAEPGYRERFRREAYTAARLTQPHIIPIYDTGEVDGRLYLVMPIIDGIDVQGLLARDGPMSPQRAVDVITQLAAALHAAHAVGLVHRDIKPSNALVTSDDFVYLIDFGIARDQTATKLTNTGMMVGTLAYMAPERFATGIVDARADVYSLACVLYECLTGAQPFPGDSVGQQIGAHLTLEPPKPRGLNPAVPAGFDEVIAVGMAKDPDQRYQSARELATAARHALTAAAPPGDLARGDDEPSPLAAAADTAQQPATDSTLVPPPPSRRSVRPAKTRQLIQRDELGALTEIGQGRQGVVYRAPDVQTKFAASMVYKEYRAQARAGVDFIALAAMPALVDESLPHAEAERLISIAAWPCALVEDDGTSTGFVMPAIRDQFFVQLTMVNGVSSTTAEFERLLNHSSVLAARGIAVDDVQRYSLLREVAAGLAFLHKHGVCVGDISPKNLLFSLAPREAVYFIGCDAVRINGVSALPQRETPGWRAPVGEELATIYSDAYKLGLLALRLMAGDHDTTNPHQLPSNTPGLLRQIITDTLSKAPQQRPLPETWIYVLGNAIEQAQQQRRYSFPTSPQVGVPAAPPTTPAAYSRPSSYPSPPRPSPTVSPGPTVAASVPARQPSSAAKIWGGVILAVVIVVVSALITAMLVNHSNPESASSPATSSTEPPSNLSPTTTEAPPADPEAAALQQLQQLAAGDRAYVSAQLANYWIPQLSSKKPGITDPDNPGVVYNNQRILQEFQGLQQQYGAKLLWSPDWSTFDAPPDCTNSDPECGYWVIVVPMAFSDSDSALGWCTSQHLNDDHCYAQNLVPGRAAHNPH